MALSGAQITRLGVSGFARPPYGSFAGKTGTLAPVRTAGGGSALRRARRRRTVVLSGVRYRVGSLLEEHLLLQNYLAQQQSSLPEAAPAEQRGIRISLTKVRKRMEAIEATLAAQRAKEKMRREEEDLITLLMLH